MRPPPKKAVKTSIFPTMDEIEAGYKEDTRPEPTRQRPKPVSDRYQPPRKPAV